MIDNDERAVRAERWAAAWKLAALAARHDLKLARMVNRLISGHARADNIERDSARRWSAAWKRAATVERTAARSLDRVLRRVTAERDAADERVVVLVSQATLDLGTKLESAHAENARLRSAQPPGDDAGQDRAPCGGVPASDTRLREAMMPMPPVPGHAWASVRAYLGGWKCAHCDAPSEAHRGDDDVRAPCGGVPASDTRPCYFPRPEGGCLHHHTPLKAPA